MKHKNNVVLLLILLITSFSFSTTIREEMQGFTTETNFRNYYNSNKTNLYKMRYFVKYTTDYLVKNSHIDLWDWFIEENGSVHNAIKSPYAPLIMEGILAVGRLSISKDLYKDVYRPLISEFDPKKKNGVYSRQEAKIKHGGFQEMLETSARSTKMTMAKLGYITAIEQIFEDITYYPIEDLDNKHITDMLTWALGYDEQSRKPYLTAPFYENIETISTKAIELRSTLVVDSTLTEAPGTILDDHYTKLIHLINTFNESREE